MQKRLKSILFFLILFSLFISKGSSAEILINEKGKWEGLISGLEYRIIKITAEKGPSDIFSLRVNPKKLNIKVLDSRDYGQKRLTVKTMAMNANAIAVINGGFFDTDDNHLGLLIRDSKVVSPYKKRDWGIFMMKNGRPYIIHSRSYKEDKEITQAVQVGPRLISRGRIMKLKRQFSRRSAVGIDNKGRVVFLVSGKTMDGGVMSLLELAELMGLPEARGGLGCKYALNLDGGASTQLYIEINNFRRNLPGGWAVSNSIGVFLK